MRLFKEAISGQNNPAYCGAETALGAYNRYEVARRNAQEKGDHSHAARWPVLLHQRLLDVDHRPGLRELEGGFLGAMPELPLP